MPRLCCTLYVTASDKPRVCSMCRRLHVWYQTSSSVTNRRFILIQTLPQDMCFSLWISIHVLSSRTRRARARGQALASYKPHDKICLHFLILCMHTICSHNSKTCRHRKVYLRHSITINKRKLDRRSLDTIHPHNKIWETSSPLLRKNPPSLSRRSRTCWRHSNNATSQVFSLLAV